MPAPSEPSLALVLCIRNEETFLAANLAYHHALGVSRAYLFLDRCTDASLRIAQSFPWVTAIPRDRDPADRWMSAHQVKCLDDGLEMARADGVEWLLHLDPDEFACSDRRSPVARWAGSMLPGRRPEPAQRGSLTRMLARAKPGTEQVILKPNDVIPTPLGAGAPFWKLQHFQMRGVLERPLLDPTTDEVVQFGERLGHYHGKSIVRTAADVQARSAHRWMRRGAADAERGRIPTERRGFHYHYVVVDGRQWRDKHRKFAEYPDRWEKGNPVRFPKQAWKEASVTMSEEEALRYFDRWVAIQPRRLRVPMLLGQVVRDSFVEDVLRQVGFEGASSESLSG